MAVKGLKAGIRLRSPCFAPVKTVPHGGSDEKLVRIKYRRRGLAALKVKLRINCIDEPHLRVCMHTRLVHFVHWTDSQEMCQTLREREQLFAQFAIKQLTNALSGGCSWLLCMRQDELNYCSKHCDCRLKRNFCLLAEIRRHASNSQNLVFACRVSHHPARHALNGVAKVTATRPLRRGVVEGHKERVVKLSGIIIRTS